MTRRLLPLLLLTACAPTEAEMATPGSSSSVRTTEQAAIYGEDDRRDYYQVEDERLRALTDGAIVAMMDPRSVDIDRSGNVSIDGNDYGPTYNLCRDVAFYDQINAASCSATLIDDDLVLTAGHCVQSTSACQGQRWVFRFYMESETELASMIDEDVFGCSRVVVRELSESRSGRLDYAIIQLDRPATPRFTPAPVARNVRLDEGDPVVIIGFGSGLPAKIDDGGQVTEARASVGDYFEATTDSFGGNSGSGVFNDDGEVIGILVNGQNDYSWGGRCSELQTYPASGSSYGAEGITYAERAIEELCESGHPSTRLCGTDAECGDGVCSPGEATGCAEDCQVEIPGWSCDPALYGDGGGCDCACGVLDPDCRDPDQAVLNCASGEVCGIDGACAEPGTGPDPGEQPPAGWACPPELWGDGEACDCACGALDPDCTNLSLPIDGCDEGETCNADGACVPIDLGPGPDPETDAGDGEGDGFGGILLGGGDGGGCAAGAGAVGAWLALPLFVLRRRRRR